MPKLFRPWCWYILHIVQWSITRGWGHWREYSGNALRRSQKPRSVGPLALLVNELEDDFKIFCSVNSLFFYVIRPKQRQWNQVDNQNSDLCLIMFCIGRQDRFAYLRRLCTKEEKKWKDNMLFLGVENSQDWGDLLAKYISNLLLMTSSPTVIVNKNYSQVLRFLVLLDNPPPLVDWFIIVFIPK